MYHTYEVPSARGCLVSPPAAHEDAIPPAPLSGVTTNLVPVAD